MPLERHSRATWPTLTLAILLSAGLIEPSIARAAPATMPGPTVTVTAPAATVKAQGSAIPTFRLFGIRTQLNAPVAPPYAGSAYRTLGGQPETGADVIAAQGFVDQRPFADPTPP
jgi:hypothetical protein